MMRPDLETTCRISRDELSGLLETMATFDKQRITAPLAAVSPEPEPIDEPAVIHSPALPRFQITFRPSSVRSTMNVRPRSIPVIALSFAVSLALGLACLIVA
ncbi:MAG: hypothetical protein HOV81_30495 [Kofleriaceae bacterium]|nr:hypothetical protein [Kofleriaceae bacterium]